jgi:hypothetical protein
MKAYKTYAYGPYKYTMYYKKVGEGYEVSLKSKDYTVFVGNFIHKKEATAWCKYFSKQISYFFKKYSYYSFDKKQGFYSHFMKNHFYKVYYAWLNTMFKKYSSTYNKAFSKDLKYYNTKKKTYAQQYGSKYNYKYADYQY